MRDQFWSPCVREKIENLNTNLSKEVNINLEWEKNHNKLYILEC